MLKDTCGVEWCDQPVRRVGLCHTHSMYQRRHQFGVTHFISPTQAECLWGRFQKQPNGCWHWIGGLNVQGYGLVGSRPKQLAHRAMYELVIGPIPDGLTVDHECHNLDQACPGGEACLHRRCVNPSHLALETPGDNARKGMMSRPTCRRGHVLDATNALVDAQGRRWCQACARVRRAARAVTR